MPQSKSYLIICKRCRKAFASESRGYRLCAGCYKKTDNYPREFYKRRKVLVNQNSECKICRRKQGENHTELHLHHIDENTYNNDVNNLEVLCYQCHISSHRNKNKKLLGVEYGLLGVRLKYGRI